MRRVIYETETAIFQFDRTHVMEHLKNRISKRPIDDVIQLIDFITSTPGETIKIPDEYDYFGYVVLTLIEENKGSIVCKTCNETYMDGNGKVINRFQGMFSSKTLKQPLIV